jgi:hypothetical protein|tara:strand:- start:1203 stop:1625 length:423 start_codon:yes stop_codon:yes gene_type:complete
MINKYAFTLLIGISTLMGQSPIFESEPGYIRISADTTNIPVYIDGTLMGHTPFSKSIPVLEGVHRISHHPPSIHDPFISYGDIESVKKIFVLSGDTVNIHLNTALLTAKIHRAKSEYRMTNYAGVGLSMLVLWQLWVLSN